MLEAKGVNKNEYLEYKGKPLVRQDNEIIYGDMSDNYYIYMMIMTEKDTENGSVPDKIMVQLRESSSGSPKEQKVVNGLKVAFDYADAWLERFNK
ncbi:MAG: hypothetical protein IKV43_03860 [Clostridia bacterium]|nr:hypothetical protein [Clostridia bacterium]